MKQIATIITLLLLCFANVQAQKILKPKWSTAHVSHVAHFSKSGNKLLTVGGQTIDVWDCDVDTLLYRFTNVAKIADAKFNVDGKKIAAVTTNGTLYIIDARTGKQIHAKSLGYRGFRSVEFSNNGKEVLVISPFIGAQVWSVLSGNIITEIPTTEGEIFRGGFSNNGSYVVLCFNNKAQIFDSETGDSIKVFSHSGGIYNAMFEKEDEFLLTASSENGIRMWDIKSGEILYTIPYLSSNQCAQLSPNGKYFLYVSNFEIIIREVSTGEKITTFKTDYADEPRVLHAISNVQFNNTSEYVVNTDYDGNARLWNIKSGKLSCTFPLRSRHGANYCEFDVSGRRFLTASQSGVVTIMDTVTKQTYKEHIGYSGYPGAYSYPEFKYNGERVFAAAMDNTIKVWNAESGNPELLDFQYQEYGYFTNIQFCSNNRFTTSSVYGLNRIRDMHTLEIIDSVPNLSEIPVFMPDCKSVVYRDRTLYGLEVYDLESDSVIKRIKDSTSQFSKKRINLSGNLIAVQIGTYINIWSLHSDSLMQHIGLPSSDIDFIEFVDDKTLIVKTANPEVLFWIDVEKGTFIRKYFLNTSPLYTCLSRDKSKLIVSTGEKIIRIWDARTSKMLRNIDTDGITYCVDFSTDEKLMLTAENGGVSIYNVQTKKIVAKSLGYYTIIYAKFNETDDRIVTSDNDGTIRVWDLGDLMTSTNSNDYTNNYNIFVSPNPATDEITIKGISSDLPVAYTFTDLIGNTIHNCFIPEQTDTYTLSTRNFPPGFYNVTFQMNGAKHTEKLTVVR